MRNHSDNLCMRWLVNPNSLLSKVNLVGGLEHGFYFSIFFHIFWEFHHPS